MKIELIRRLAPFARGRRLNFALLRFPITAPGGCDHQESRRTVLSLDAEQVGFRIIDESVAISGPRGDFGLCGGMIEKGVHLGQIVVERVGADITAAIPTPEMPMR